jgi:hypothetical protein
MLPKTRVVLKGKELRAEKTVSDSASDPVLSNYISIFDTSREKSLKPCRLAISKAIPYSDSGCLVSNYLGPLNAEYPLSLLSTPNPGGPQGCHVQVSLPSLVLQNRSKAKGRVRTTHRREGYGGVSEVDARISGNDFVSSNAIAYPNFEDS